MIKIQLNKIKFNKLIFAIFFFLAPFTVSGYYQNITPIGPTSVLIMGLVFVYTLIYLLKKRYISLDRFEFKVIFLFLFPIIFSFIGILFQVLTNNNIHYNVYMKSDLFNRLILIAFNITILTGLLNITKKWSLEKIKNLIKYYYYGVFLFSLIGFWQFLHFLFDIPYLNIETRSFVYGVSSFNFIIGKRLTSLANEPSFFAPLIIDLVLLALILKKKPFKTIILGVFLLMFSYSAGGYFNFSIVIFASIVSYIKYKNYYLNKKYFFISVITSIA